MYAVCVYTRVNFHVPTYSELRRAPSQLPLAPFAMGPQCRLLSPAAAAAVGAAITADGNQRVPGER